jgi:hypothetical protein
MGGVIMNLPTDPAAYLTIPRALVMDARQWLKDVEWADLEPEDVDRLTAKVVVRGVERHYDGGWLQFVADHS